ncbi:aldehyde dehydrogenase family protein [Nocardioides sp.]|uniref:aldehyde dehydrogenase family protein n=1 Tax=Nocardioides sp. TaxID=35761 RepID=UPI00345DAAAD
MAGGAGTTEVLAPATGQAIATVSAADINDPDRAVAAAWAAHPGWVALPYTDRAAVMARAAALLEADPERLTPMAGPRVRCSRCRHRRGCLLRDVGTFQQQGQICVATGRHLVPERQAGREGRKAGREGRTPPRR